MRKILTILCCTFILFTQSKAQSDTISGDYIVLYSGKIIQSDVVTYKNSYFHAGDKKYNEDDVSLYRNAEGSFANAKHFKKRGATYFLKASKTGPVNIYSLEITASKNGSWSNGSYKPAYTETTEYVFYNKGMERLKKAKYKNLKRDLGDNVNCNKVLKKYRNIRTARIILYPVSAIVFAFGIKTAVKETYDNPVLNYVAAPLGIILFFVAQAGRDASINKAKKAIEIYNQ